MMMEGSTKSEKKKYRRWSKCVEMDGITKKIEVREVENGYVICKSMYGKMEGSEEYIDERKEYISTTNPMEEKSKKMEDKEEEMEEEKEMDMLKSIKKMLTKIDM